MLDPTASRHRRNDPSIVERLQRTLQDNPDDIVLDVLAASETGLIKPEIIRKSGLSEQEVTSALKRLANESRVVEHGGRWLAQIAYGWYCRQV